MFRLGVVQQWSMAVIIPKLHHVDSYRLFIFNFSTHLTLIVRLELLAKRTQQLSYQLYPAGALAAQSPGLTSPGSLWSCWFYTSEISRISCIKYLQSLGDHGHSRFRMLLLLLWGGRLIPSSSISRQTDSQRLQFLSSSWSSHESWVNRSGNSCQADQPNLLVILHDQPELTILP